MTRATAPLAESLPAMRVQKSMTGFSESSVRNGTPAMSPAMAAPRSVEPVRPRKILSVVLSVAIRPILTPEEATCGTRVRVPVVRDVPHVPVEPMIADLPLCHVLQMPQHVGEMLVRRLHAVLPPDDHRGLTDLALGDPADLVLVKPWRDAFGLAQHAVVAHQYLFAMGSSSAGNSVMICAPAGVTMTSSSIRAADVP